MIPKVTGSLQVIVTCRWYASFALEFQLLYSVSRACLNGLHLLVKTCRQMMTSESPEYCKGMIQQVRSRNY